MLRPLIMQLWPLCFFLSLVVPTLSYRIFDSRDRLVRSVIEQCVSKTPIGKETCYTTLRCIIDKVPSDFPARWSSGASILAFIPTIVALLSNSIDEVSSIADESRLLAVALSLSFVTAFILRSRGNTDMPSDSFFADASMSGSDRSQLAWAKLETWMSNRKIQPLKSWRPPWRISKYAICILLVALGALIWYEVYEISRYGIITFACPVKVNVGIWVGMSQLLVLLNVGCRHYAFDIRVVRFRHRDFGLQRRNQATTPLPSNCERKSAAFPSENSNRGPSVAPVLVKPNEKLVAPVPIQASEPLTIVLRCPRNQLLRWLLQTFTAVASLTLYSYGTVILASMTLIPASDAIRAMIVLAISAGVARLLGYWAASPSKRGNRFMMIDVPPDCMARFHALVSEKAAAMS